jgi:hypothetical protein
VGVTFRFLAVDNESDCVLRWFRSLPEPPREYKKPYGWLLYFSACGQIAHDQTEPDRMDVKRSPLVTVFLPQKKRGVLWTVGEVHFLSTPLKLFPKLEKIKSAFRNWLKGFECVYSGVQLGKVGQWDYFLEGSIRNFDPEVFALPKGMELLRQGQYFVADGDNDWVLDKVCRALKLRGITGIK